MKTTTSESGVRKQPASRLGYPCAFILLCVAAGCGPLVSLVVPEQRHIEFRDPAQLPPTPLPSRTPPETVSQRVPASIVPQQLSLDDCITIALRNAQVVRVLVGVAAVASGQTIYSPAISNTRIDVARANFDPFLTVNNNFTRNETPQGFVSPTDPVRAQLQGTRVDQYTLDSSLNKNTITGGVFSFGVSNNLAKFQPGVFPINPQNTRAITLGFTQPLLAGAGVAPNVAPIIVARINTERSYFQFKDALQELVRGTIEAYWAVVFARTDVWVREQQVEQGKEAYERAEGRLKFGFGNSAEVAQARTAYANFRANLIGAEANLLQREAALRSIMGLPPTEPLRLVPVTQPNLSRLEPIWDSIVDLAQERRPDLIELKLILEADRQNLIVARNQALPQVDTVFQYQWDGLSGKTPSRQRISTEAGQFTDWTLGVNFSVPLGLRQGRAGVRNAQLLLLNDQANLEQGLLAASHDLAASVRNLAQFYEQYEAFKEARAAARINLAQQIAENRAGRAIFLNVLQAISDWGNAVSAEAQALSQYNTELATLERVTGTILETHGVVLAEERFGSVGPLGRLAKPRPYPESIVPGPNAPNYPSGTEPAEKVMELELPTFPTAPKKAPEESPKPRPVPEPKEKPAKQP